jgi:hypothetical protein
MSTNDFVIPKSPGIKRKLRNICSFKEHDWTGQYHDGWLFLDCTKCEAKNIQHKLSKRQVMGLVVGSYNWNVNNLPIYVDRFGNHVSKRGYPLFGYLDDHAVNDTFYESVKTLAV